MPKKQFRILYISLLVLYVISVFQVKKLPEESAINLALLADPIQKETAREEFNFLYRGTDYTVIPKADYELWGVVVSVNNINAWYNYYHDKNSVNLKDICVVWGENISGGVYRDKNISFKSGEWTCYYRWSGKLQKKFYKSKLSNNHLLSADERVQDVIRDLHIGDQVHIKGILADYSEIGKNQYRKSSMTRTDTGNGACEVLYTDEIEVFRKNQVFWNIVHRFSLKMFFALLILQIFLFFRRNIGGRRLKEKQNKQIIFHKQKMKTMSDQKITKNIYKFSHDSNLYYLQDLEMIFDCGDINFTKELKDELAQVLDFKKIKTVLLSHFHYDHLGCFFLFPNAKFYASPKAISGFEKDKVSYILDSDLANDFKKKIYNAMQLKLPKKYQILLTPGHCQSGLCLYEKDKKILFSGDTLFFGGAVGRYDLPTSNYKDLEKSIGVLKKLDVKILCPGHDY